jgi:hypothetical protein
MNARSLVPLTLTLIVSTAQAADAPVWPADVKAKDDPRLLAFYDQQCASYADQQEDLADRDAYIAACREKIAAVFPAGSAKPGGGE